MSTHAYKRQRHYFVRSHCNIRQEYSNYLYTATAQNLLHFFYSQSNKNTSFYKFGRIQKDMFGFISVFLFFVFDLYEKKTGWQFSQF